MADFKVSFHENGNVVILALAGTLDLHTTPELEKAFTQLINAKKYNVVVNFEDLAYISSAGLGVFMAYIETMRDNNGDIKFSNMSSKIYNIFDLLGFPLLYEFYKEEKEAVQKFSESN